MKMQQISAIENTRRYGAAILAAFTALFLYRLLSPALDGENPYHTAWAAVVFSAWYGGLGPSILVILLDLIGIWYWFLPPAASFQLLNPRADISGMLGFVVFSGLIVALGEAHRRSLAKSRLAEEQLRSAQAELERKVQERTAELSMANENLRELSGHLQQLRDDERKQIARELHDSVGQLLAGLSMNIATYNLSPINSIPPRRGPYPKIQPLSSRSAKRFGPFPTCCTRLCSMWPALHRLFAGTWTASRNAATLKSNSRLQRSFVGSPTRWRLPFSASFRNVSQIFIATPEATGRR
jgi:hypothetical protein